MSAIFWLCLLSLAPQMVNLCLPLGPSDQRRIAVRGKHQAKRLMAPVQKESICLEPYPKKGTQEKARALEVYLSWTSSAFFGITSASHGRSGRRRRRRRRLRRAERAPSSSGGGQTSGRALRVRPCGPKRIDLDNLIIKQSSSYCPISFSNH